MKKSISIISILILFCLLFSYSTPATYAYSNQSNSSGGDSLSQYYNVGQVSSLNFSPCYSMYNLCSELEIGDIIYEFTGGFSITHHIAIVESIQYDSIQEIYWIRLIEAIDVGVFYGVLYDYRFTTKIDSIYRVSNLTTSQKQSLISFLTSQIGKPYFLNPFINFSSDSTSWYCSELCAASYYSIGIFLTGMVTGDTGYLYPNDIIQSNLLTSIPASQHVHHYDHYHCLSSANHLGKCVYCGLESVSPHFFRRKNNYRICSFCGYRIYDSGLEEGLENDGGVFD